MPPPLCAVGRGVCPRRNAKLLIRPVLPWKRPCVSFGPFFIFPLRYCKNKSQKSAVVRSFQVSAFSQLVCPRTLVRPEGGVTDLDFSISMGRICNGYSHLHPYLKHYPGEVPTVPTFTRLRRRLRRLA